MVDFMCACYRFWFITVLAYQFVQIVLRSSQAHGTTDWWSTPARGDPHGFSALQRMHEDVSHAVRIVRYQVACLGDEHHPHACSVEMRTFA